MNSARPTIHRLQAYLYCRLSTCVIRQSCSVPANKSYDNIRIQAKKKSDTLVDKGTATSLLLDYKRTPCIYDQTHLLFVKVIGNFKFMGL
jgi:hypothetical protein